MGHVDGIIYCIIMKWETLQIKTLDSNEINFCPFPFTRFSIFFFIIIIYFWGRNVGIFSVHLSAATELKRLRFYCHGRVSSVLGGRNFDFDFGFGVDISDWWEKIWNLYGHGGQEVIYNKCEMISPIDLGRWAETGLGFGVLKGFRWREIGTLWRRLSN